MPEVEDPTFYRSPTAAIAAPPEQLAYVAAFDPAREQRDAMTVVDCDGLGGASVLTDCVPSKTLIATAEVMTTFDSSYEELGIIVANVPTLSASKAIFG